MSTTGTPKRTPVTNRTGPRKRRVEHFFDRRAGEFAMTAGVDVRTYCGIWIGFSESSTVDPLRETGLRPDDCKRCLASLKKIGRDLIRRESGQV